MPLSQDEQKKAAACVAVDAFVRSGMAVGLGTGSTSEFVVRRLAERIAAGEIRDVTCASTSEATSSLASGLGLEVRPLEDLPLPLDVTIDGADEIFLSPSSISQPGHQRAILIKGRGGALLREKLVETNSKFFVCVADESKVVNPETFGTTGAVPVEVTPFAAKVTLRSILREAAASFARAKAKAGADWREGEEGKLAAESAIEKNANKFGIRAEFRGATAAEGESGEARRFQTDNGNFIVDLYFEKPIPDALDLHTRLAEIVGVVETGFFLSVATTCVVAKADGTVQQVQLTR